MEEYRFDQIVINITEKKKPVEEDKYTYIGLEHLDSQNLKVSRWGSDIAPKGEKLVMKKGDVLFGKRRAYQKKVAIAPFDGIFSAHGMVLRPNEEIIDKNFFPLFISSDYFLDAAIKISVGSLSPTINWRDLKELKFQLPDLDKQKKLADMLWSINRTLLRYKELLNKTDELVKSQFIEMFMNTDRVRLDTMAFILMGQSPTSDSYNFDAQGLPFYQGSADFSEKYVKTRMYCSAPTRIAKSGDVLMSVRAPVGTVNLTDKECCIGRGLAAIRSKKSQEYNEFLLYAFRVMKDKIASMGQGSTVLSINKDNLHGLLMPNADKHQQEQFIAFAQQSDKSKFVSDTEARDFRLLSSLIRNYDNMNVKDGN
ncbi:restriction endonuclease subunit S [Enterococcus gallinarum]|uniref:restriction endonuclease subunit S n=1 Tax=Enterococcus gallinarum TaxID=1353 RepID=UPI001F04269B|nr:restriction endonuclease subunit S [Enterococcus gallinarum]